MECVGEMSDWPALAVPLALAITFALVKGLNDGAALVAVSGTGVPILPLAAISLLGAAVLLGPLVIGTRVADVFASGLVPADSGAARLSFLIGVAAAMAVAAFLAMRGLPTSLTMAIIGGLTGAGVGSGLRVAWTTVVIVVACGLAVPLLAGLAGSGLLALLSRVIGGRGTAAQLRWVKLCSFAFQAVAYSANDGQSMLAVFAVAIGSTTVVSAHFGQLAVIAAAFCAGTLIGLARVGRRLELALAHAGPADGIAAELASTASAFAARAVGAPVSMTQTMSAGLVGARTRAGLLRVRWEQAAGLFTAWAVTLPSAAVVACLAAAGVRVLR